MSDKYVSFRIEKCSNDTIKQSYQHNKREGFIPKYIDTSKTHLNECIFGGEIDFEKYKREQNKRGKRKIQKNTDRFFNGIFTFSESMSNDYLNNPELFKECSINFIEYLQKELNCYIPAADLHLDERTPHIHLIFDNITPNGQTVRKHINPKILSNLQTKMGEFFKPMGYKRGKPIEETKIKHLSVKDLHKYGKIKDELLKQLKGEINDLKIEINDLVELEKEHPVELDYLFNSFLQNGTVENLKLTKGKNYKKIIEQKLKEKLKEKNKNNNNLK
jgi:hypothetical protein